MAANRSHSDEKKHNPYRSVLSSSISGWLEVLAFQPLDNASNRLMNNRGSIRGNFFEVAFQGELKNGLLPTLRSGYKGSISALSYKTVQRGYRFGFQPVVDHAINNAAGQQIINTFGEKNQKTVSGLFSGFVIGQGELGLLPLDKIKKVQQTRKKQLGVKISFWQDCRKVIANDPFAGWKQASPRNALGSPILFGAREFFMAHLFNVDHNNKKPTLLQNWGASTMAGILSVTTVAPWDTVKTRNQVAKDVTLAEQGSSVKVTGLTFRDVVKNEGLLALWRGTFTKSILNGGRVGFVLTAAKEIDKAWDTPTGRTILTSLNNMSLFSKSTDAAKIRVLEEEERIYSSFNLQP